MSKPRGAAWAGTLVAFALAGTSICCATASANDAVDAIEALAPAEQRAESIEWLRAYAPPAPSVSLLPEGPVRRRPEVFAIPTVAPMPAHIPRRLLEQRAELKTTRLEDELNCLATAVYFEARGEPYFGQVAVAQVILNRVADPDYPKTICDVVYENSHVHNACQFSFTCDGIADRIREPRAWRWAKRIARSVLFRQNRVIDFTMATNYHASYVSPRWAGQMKMIRRIGLHIFYRG